MSQIFSKLLVNFAGHKHIRTMLLYKKTQNDLKILQNSHLKNALTKNEFLGAFLDDFSSQHCNPDHSTLGYFYV